MAEAHLDKKGKAKRSRKRKIRTAVSSSESSDDEKPIVEPETSNQPKQAEDELRKHAKRERRKSAKSQDTINNAAHGREDEVSCEQPAKRTKSKARKDVSPKQPSPKPSKNTESSSLPQQPLPSAENQISVPNTTNATAAPVIQTPTDFESWYLRKMTSEFAEDLDKIRSAPDFHDYSLPILVEALKQGASIFTAEEKARVLGGVG